MPATSLSGPATTSASSVVCGTTTTPAAALTTIFTPGSDCVWPMTNWPAADGCMPNNFGPYWKCTTVSDYYSPAICPSDYTPVASRWDTAAGPAVTSGETAWQCCPSKYTTIPGGWRSYCYSSYVLSGSTTTNFAYGVQIRWQASDLSILETLPLSPGVKYNGQTVTSGGSSSATSVSATTTSAQRTSTKTGKPTSTGSSDSGLSTGAKAGIGIGVALLALAVLAGAFLLYRRRRRQRPDPALGNTEGNEKRDFPVAAIGSEPVELPTKKPTVKRTIPDEPVELPTKKPTVKRAAAESQPFLPLANSGTDAPEATGSPVPAPYAHSSHNNSGHFTPAAAATGQPYSDLEVVPSDGLEVVADERKLAQLREEQSRIRERRNRLLSLQQLEEEEERIQREISDIERRRT